MSSDVSGNIAFVCQRHNAKVVINELGLNNASNITSTYVKAVKPVVKTVSDNTSLLKNKFNFEVNEINKKIPNYWNPKLHKNSTKSRFIIAAPRYSV